MEELIKILEQIVNSVDGDLRKDALIENETDNPLVDAYNEGIEAMTNQVCHHINAIIDAKRSEKTLDIMTGRIKGGWSND